MNNETKVAQYGQWDGYPNGVGKDVLDFLTGLGGNYDAFKERISKLRWISEEENKVVDADKDWIENYPHLSRDRGGDILNCIFHNKFTKSQWVGNERKINEYPCNVEFLVNSEYFASDSLFCEWAYVIDLDKNTFEVYKGFNKSVLEETDRFYNTKIAKENSEYKQVKLIKSYDLLKLPDINNFLNDFKEDEEDE